jgi:hypothetical protein
MARNRKSQSAGTRFGPALKAFLLCLLIGGSGVGYVWQKEQIVKLGEKIKLREAKLHALEAQNDVLRQRLGKMRTLDFLELQIRKAGLGLAKPQDAQILRLPEPVVVPARVPHPEQYAARNESATVGP